MAGPNVKWDGYLQGSRQHHRWHHRQGKSQLVPLHEQIIRQFFELHFEVKVHDGLNSGVQIRSQSKGGTPDGRVNGPQVEIEACCESGYIYGRVAGGWMTPKDMLKPHKHFKKGKWNSYRVIAEGARIQTWINGTQISDLVDEEKLKTHPKGFIGLQVHGVGKRGPFDVCLRNIKIREIK